MIIAEWEAYNRNSERKSNSMGSFSKENNLHTILLVITLLSTTRAYILIYSYLQKLTPSEKNIPRHAKRKFMRKNI